jgi:hypothetical protein
LVDFCVAFSALIVPSCAGSPSMFYQTRHTLPCDRQHKLLRSFTWAFLVGAGGFEPPTSAL